MNDRAQPQIAINDKDGRQVGSADIHVAEDGAVRASLHVEPGQLEPGTRERLVDAVLDDPEVSAHRHVQVAVPLGDTAMLDRVRDRSDSDQTRAVGASCLIDAELPAPQAEPRA